MAKADRRSRGPRAEQRYFELPFTATAPELINTELGLCTLSVRGGDHAPYTIEVTLLDAPDHRLIRAGILLAHRICEGRGEWYLSAPEWSPWLPSELIEPMATDDLPDQLADLVRPFRRGATLGPVAGLHCRRAEYTLRGRRAEVLAVLRDDSVTVRSGGVTTARYREVTVTPLSLDARQQAWITETLQIAGATRLAAFPSLPQRLGAPATGLTDIPGATESETDGPLDSFVSAVFAARLRDLTHADVALRAGAAGAYAQLLSQLRTLRSQVRALGVLLERGWVETVETDLEWILEGAFDDIDSEVLNAKLSGERYLGMLDRIVAAGRTPRLGDLGTRRAGKVLQGLLAEAYEQFVEASTGLDAAASDHRWDAALQAGERVLDICQLPLDRPKQLKACRRRLAKLVATLEDCVGAHQSQWLAEAEQLSPREAFNLGRDFERAWSDQQVARADYAEQWERQHAKLAAILDPAARGRR